ncbi:MAG: peroxidase family protein, partial [Novosphingobium sp.]
MYSSSLKPFVLNASDLAFILKQINFRPLFDAAGNAIVNWTGVGAIYDGHGNQIWDGTTGGLTAQQALDAYGPSYASTTSSQGLRDVSGLNNNLHLINAGYGASDQDFLRTVAAEYDLDAHGHVYYSGSPAYVSGTDQFDAPIYGTAYWANKVYANAFGGVAGFTLPVGTSVDYAITDANNDQAIQTTELNNIVDYTPRMISRLITTGGVTFQLDVNGHIDYSNGVASVTDWGLLQTLGIQDAQARFDGTPGTIEVTPGVFENEYFVGAQNPGVSPTNGWFTIFGQFFDHGLDFIDKGGQGKSIKITFAADDPLYGELGSDGRPATYISVARATVDGFDAEGNPTYINHTAPLIDQSQSYGSHAAVTELLREWVIDPVDGVWKPGMNLLNGITLATPWQKSDGTMTTETLPSLNELRAHMLESGRADLTWDDIFNFNGSDQALILDMNPHFDGAHMLKGDVNQDAAVNAAIAFLGDPLNGAIRGESAPGAGDGDSFALVSGTLTLVLGTDLAAGPSTIPAGTYTGANAMMIWVNFANFGVMSTSAIGNTTVGAVGDAVGTLLLSSVGDHYIAGDGRVNENFGLTTVHHVFHEEHNFQIENIKETIHREADARNGGMVDGLFDAEYMKGFQNWDAAGVGWNAATGNWETDGGLGGGQVAWNLDTMFNAAKLVVEMEYQHVAIDQYARTVTPDIKEFVGYTAGEDPTISLEYAQAIFRFGHSQLRETIDTIDPDHGLTGKITGYALKLAFLNPEEYANLGPAAIALGMTHQQGNEIDELITPALNQGLLGLPLDLAAINIARGRDVGLPGLNEFRQAVGLRAYDGWADFGANMVHPDNLVNFIAAYTFDGDAAKAQAVIDLYDGNYANDAAAVALATSLGLTQGTMTNPEFAAYAADYALTFMNGGDKGVNNIDTWIGGLAEVHVTGGLLGETFNLVFVDQMERIQDGDRFYYLYRLVNQQFADEIAGGQFKDIIERNTGLTHLGGSAFSYSDQYYDFGATVDAANTVNNNHKYGAQLEAPGNTKGIFTDGGSTQVRDGLSVTVRITDPVTGQIVSRQFIRDTRVTDPNAPNSGTGIDGTDNSGAESTEVIVGTRFDDLIYARGGDDTVYGEAGNDIIYGGNGIDRLYGGDGKDYIYGGDGAELTDGGAGDDFIYGDSSATAAAGTDQLIGGMGNDYISGGIGIDKLAGGGGDDVIMGEGETDPFTHGGDGNDYIDGGISGDNLYGDNGDDLIIGGADQDILYGGNGDDILRPGNPSQALGGGPDEVLGGDGVYDNGFDLIDFSDNNPSTTGIVFDLTNQNNPQVQIDGTTAIPAATQMEGIIGSVSNDTLTGQSTAGTATGTWLIGGSGNDTLKGGLGNDIIIGGSLRLDDMIGHYDSGYTHNNNNDSGNAVGLTDIDANGVAHTFTQEEMNRLYQGASHRVAWDDELDVFSGLIDTINDQTWGDGTLAEKHFTEMLRTEKFKDLSLGDVAGQTNGGTDTVVFTGNSADYVFEALVFVDHAGNTHYGAAVTDSVVGRDGSDSVLDVANYTFANGTFTLAQLLAPPTASVGNATVTEGNAGTVNASFTVSLAYPAANDVTVTYTTVDGTAGAPGDYTSTPGSVTILAGQVSATVTVPVLGDTTFEANETFSINLTGADNGVTIASGTGTGTITNDDTAPTLSLSGGTVSEGDSGTSTITFTVTQSAVSGTATTVNWGTTDGTASSASDFAGGTGSVTIAAGDTSATFTVTVNGDTAIEGDEAFTVSLSAPVNATIATGTATGTI